MPHERPAFAPHPAMTPVKIRPYAAGDEATVLRIWKECHLIAPQNDPKKDIRRKLCVPPEWFLVGEINGQIAATCMAGYEGHRGWINYLAVLPEFQRNGIATKIMAEAERLLREAGCPKINLQVRATNPAAIEFYKCLGYSIDRVTSMGRRLEVDEPARLLCGIPGPIRNIQPRPAHGGLHGEESNPREERFGDILLPPPPEAYWKSMRRFGETRSLVPVGLDFSGRDAFLDPETADRWTRMKEMAHGQSLKLLLISAFRSHAYQAGIIAGKLAKGAALEEILRVNAYPGFSEHHTGCAIDIGSPACSDLTEAFEETLEFRWLAANAGRFGFSLSFPRDNSSGIIYEPWHWARSPHQS